MKYEMKIKTAEENHANMLVVLKDWNLMPLNPSEDPTANKEDWIKFAKIMKVTEQESRNMLCANCEYYNNTKDMMMQMDTIPFNDTDKNAGGRGYCHEFDFICHNLRTCQAWEDREFELKDSEDSDVPKISIKDVPSLMMIGKYLKVNE